MRCPVCETENGDDVAECAQCGKVLMMEGELEPDVEPVPGLEETLQRPVDAAEGELVPGVEFTQLAPRDLPFMPDNSVQVEHTQQEENPAAPTFWTVGTVELDRGREVDDGQRTPAPQDTGTCPWCGQPADGAVCDHCGRRRSKYTTAPERLQSAAEATEERVLCPACFAKVPPGPRCIECGVPFAVPEL